MIISIYLDETQWRRILHPCSEMFVCISHKHNLDSYLNWINLIKYFTITNKFWQKILSIPITQSFFILTWQYILHNLDCIYILFDQSCRCYKIVRRFLTYGAIQRGYTTNACGAAWNSHKIVNLLQCIIKCICSPLLPNVVRQKYPRFWEWCVRNVPHSDQEIECPSQSLC